MVPTAICRFMVKMITDERREPTARQLHGMAEAVPRCSQSLTPKNLPHVEWHGRMAFVADEA